MAMRVFKSLITSISLAPLIIDDGCSGLSREQEWQVLCPADYDLADAAAQRGQCIVQLGDHSGKDQLFGLQVFVLSGVDPGDQGVFIVGIEKHAAFLERKDKADVE